MNDIRVIAQNKSTTAHNGNDNKRLKSIPKVIYLLAVTTLLAACNVDARLAKADELYKQGVYHKVEKQYLQTVGMIPKNRKALKSQVYYKIAECNRLLFNMKKADNYYGRAYKNGCKDSIIFLNWAKTQMAMGNYAGAARNFERFLQKNPTHREALDGLMSAERAKDLLRQPSRYKIGIAGIFNNKKSSDFSPSFVGSAGESLVFTSNRDVSKKQKKSDITGKLNFDMYIAKKNKADRWEKPSYFKELNVSEDDGVCSFTADGRTIFFTRSMAEGEHRGGTSIMTSTRSGGEWTEPRIVTTFKDSTIMVGHPAISPDGQSLYFVSDYRGQSFGGKDIFVCQKIGGSWSVPENLGDRINTTGNEMFPYVAADGTLYFASDGHQGFGGLDIYSARKDSIGRWVVRNMLAPMNSPNDDFGITFKGDEANGFFSSNRGNTKNVDNIYWFSLPEITFVIEGTITDENGVPLDATVKIVGNDGSIIKQRAKKNGSYRVKLKENVNYVMMASNRGYLNSSKGVTTVNEKESRVFKRNFKLPSIAKPVKMENIFYEFGKWNITKESEAELNNLVKLLEDNPNITIELSAHTDSVGTDASNIELSQKRANSAVEYLIGAGIAKDRLTAKGYGENKPVIVDSFMAQKYTFLKEGDELTPQFIAKLSKENQAICNQINRRTEFRVLRTTYNMY